jgi:hypothetical protein
MTAINLRCVTQLIVSEMRPEIPQTLKSAVTQLYLQAFSRNEIASRTKISQGAVSNIIAAWKTGLGYPLADDLRELSMILKRSGINTQQCAMGFRLAKMIQDLGVDEDNFRTFISEIYQQCSEIGLRPQKVAENVKQLLMLSESIPLWQIPQYIADKTSETRAGGRNKAIARARISGKMQPRNSFEGKRGICNTIVQILRAKNSAGKIRIIYGRYRVIC